MRIVVAIIQPQQLPAVKKSLFDAQVKHLTCTNILGTAPEGAHTMTFRGVGTAAFRLFDNITAPVASRVMNLLFGVPGACRGCSVGVPGACPEGEGKPPGDRQYVIDKSPFSVYFHVSWKQADQRGFRGFE